MTALGAVVVFLMATYPADEYRVASELEKRSFIIGYHWCDDNRIWKHPTNVVGGDQMITSDDSRLFCQLPRLDTLRFLRCDMSDLNLDEIGNCRKLQIIQCFDTTQFPVSELKKLTACPVVYIEVKSKDVHLNDSDLDEFTKFTHLDTLVLECDNAGVTDACLEYFEKIPTLKILRLLGSSITQEDIEEFKKKRPDIKIYLKVYY